MILEKLLNLLPNRKELRDKISAFIKEGAVKTALSWIVKRFAFLSSGPLGWLTTLIVSELWDYFGDKVVRWATRKGALIYDKIDGNIKAIKVKDARGSNDSSYDSSVDDILG